MALNSKQNIIRARAIMSRLPGFTEESKQAVCFEVSGGRTGSLSNLSIACQKWSSMYLAQ